jgi:hypothetical protein
MSVEGQQFFPGDEASPNQVLELADEYRRAAEVLLTKGRKGKPLSRAPYRLAAIHAIELYLNAFLMMRGHSSSSLRGLNHDLARRRRLAADEGLSLRKKTAAHLAHLSEAREYLIMRYGPEMAGKVSHLNRVQATLREVGDKVANYIRQ